MAINLGGATLLPLGAEDKSIDVVKTTAGYFTGNAGTLLGTNIHTKSLSADQSKYYADVTQTHTLSSSAESQFSVFYAHSGGSGSALNGTSSIYGETQAMYGQMSTYLLAENDVSGGFLISAGDEGLTPASRAQTTKDDELYGIIFNRSKYKDRVNTGTFSMTLQGFASTGGSGSTLHLTDDSKTVAPISTVAGDRVNLVSGSDGNISAAATTKRYGVLYADAGIALLSGTELSASIPGPANSPNVTASFSVTAATRATSSGFASNLDTVNNAQNHLRLLNCIKGSSGGGQIKVRSEQDKNRKYHFCRINPGDLNFSNNPTFTSGSRNELRHTSMHGDPVVYATGINMYDADGDLVTSGKLSKPLSNNYGVVAIIKAVLDF